ncbi:MAG: sdhC [Rickettsiaceae bacterium]|jgi:succinate dehydrogenase / fumarate reductase cytochrome b subunit|nr:sdhC [Rickettsiaceae bacterium]
MTKNLSKRPLSPHLTIYKPQISSVLSITHRITGFGLFVGSLLLSWWIILNVYGEAEWFNKIVESIPGKAFLFLWTLALYYHLLNGIRHLFWDAGKGFQIKTLNLTGILVLIGTVALTLASWLAVCFMGGN